MKTQYQTCTDKWSELQENPICHKKTLVIWVVFDNEPTCPELSSEWGANNDTALPAGSRYWGFSQCCFTNTLKIRLRMLSLACGSVKLLTI